MSASKANLQGPWVCLATGLLDEAATNYRTATGLDPLDWQPFHPLDIAPGEFGQPGAPIENVERALKLKLQGPATEAALEQRPGVFRLEQRCGPPWSPQGIITSRPA